MPPVGFEPAILASKRPQTHDLDNMATGIGHDAYNDGFPIIPRMQSLAQICKL
jgi:hypothetical protein